MTTSSELEIVCLAGEQERPAIIAAARLLADSVGAGWSLKLSFRAPSEPLPAGAVGLLSLLGEVASGRDLADVATSWHGRIARRVAAGESRLVVPTLFRHVSQGDLEIGRARIRRLNLLAIELSRDHGVAVADVDQACALIGARTLAGDYHCASPAAQATFAFMVASTILGLDLDPFLADGERQAGLAKLGSLGDHVKNQLKAAA